MEGTGAEQTLTTLGTQDWTVLSLQWTATATEHTFVIENRSPDDRSVFVRSVDVRTGFTDYATTTQVVTDQGF